MGGCANGVSSLCALCTERCYCIAWQSHLSGVYISRHVHRASSAAHLRTFMLHPSRPGPSIVVTCLQSLSRTENCKNHDNFLTPSPDLDIQRWPRDLAELQQLRHNAANRVDADREADAGGGARCRVDGRVDADHPPSRVQERAPRVAWNMEHSQLNKVCNCNVLLMCALCSIRIEEPSVLSLWQSHRCSDPRIWKQDGWLH